MSVTARYFDVNTGTTVLRPMIWLGRYMEFPIETRNWPIKDFDAPPQRAPIKVRVFRLAKRQPDADQGIYDFDFYRTRTS